MFSTLQVIFQPVSSKAIGTFISASTGKGVGILARVPLQVDLLTGKFNADSQV